MLFRSSLQGDAGNDVFVMGSALSAGDTIDGGTGNDTLSFTDSNGAGSDLDRVTNVEAIKLGAAVTVVKTVDGLVAEGATLVVDGGALSGSNSLTWDGSLETNGRFQVTGGGGNDCLIGGAKADVLVGGGGAEIGRAHV